MSFRETTLSSHIIDCAHGKRHHRLETHPAKVANEQLRTVQSLCASQQYRIPQNIAQNLTLSCKLTARDGHETNGGPDASPIAEGAVFGGVGVSQRQ